MSPTGVGLRRGRSGEEVAVWVVAALVVLCGCFQFREWLACRRSPTRRNSTARNGWAGNPSLVPSTVARRRGLGDASIISAVGLIMAGLSAPLAFSHAASTWRTPAVVLTLSAPVLS